MFTRLSSGGILAGIVGKFSIQNMSDFVPFFGIRDGFFETATGGLVSDRGALVHDCRRPRGRRDAVLLLVSDQGVLVHDCS